MLQEEEAEWVCYDMCYDLCCRRRRISGCVITCVMTCVAGRGGRVGGVEFGRGRGEAEGD